ncbi:alanine dehydrogenase [Desulfotomaculum copahuensis]|uniref:Alanine dehydrogenase n=1 Tax=Desulfotomaculum copahuensis TaxID=1838280 RepID=A0A1B7LDD3_9FIRM|nr:alanine dehydrogenase [Desulfotomaculum copahuensis]OAT81076.1 alanine dehydrogenase [Desulfotomaculum copahuensis]
MIIGVPKEIKDNEYRVGVTPAGVEAFVSAGHKVVVETGAGLGSGISNEEYTAAGAQLLRTAAEVYKQSDMIVKVKEPLPSEYDLFKEGQLLFTYLHLAPEPELTGALLKKKVAGVAYETIQTNRGELPLLIPMSEVAGCMSIQIGAQFLEKQYGGRGVLLGGVPGVLPGKVAIVGGGTVGTNAAKVAIGMGAEVIILDKNADRLRYLDDIFGSRVKTYMSNSYHIKEAVRDADLVVGAVLVPGAKTPKLVTEDMVKEMQPGSVIVDVAIDQGGCVETSDRVTTHTNPTYVKHGVIHYAVANIPGAVARTSTFALTNATLPYALELANKGLAQAAKDDIALARGINVYDGKVTYKAVAEGLNMPYVPLNELMDVPVDFMRIAS